jgi:hypothetical protein
MQLAVPERELADHAVAVEGLVKTLAEHLHEART